VIQVVAVEGYRSLRDLRTPLDGLNVVTGPNGSGNSSFYKALRLRADASRNGAAAALAREGGLPSALWAGPAVLSKSVKRGEHLVQGTARRGPVHLRMGFSSDEFGYAMDLGLPTKSDSAFQLDPEIKCEAVWHGPVLRPAALLCDRHGGKVRLRDASGTWVDVPGELAPYDSMLAEVASVDQAPELVLLRRQLQGWRFYDHFRTDSEAPARRAQIGTRTTALAHDGADLAAALQTIVEIGDAEALGAAVDAAFPGSALSVRTGGGFLTSLQQPGMLRPLPAAELSDGTLRYLLLVAALLTPRPPELLVFNEPETSLHPDLHGALADLMVSVAERTQIVVVSHSARFVERLSDGTSARLIELRKELGETVIEGQGLMGRGSWQWPER
jgi:predicted ATPase